MSIKEYIKFLSEQQRLIKPQRKTKYFTGNRSLSPFEAYHKALSNKWELRHLNIAYQIIRGKEPSFPKKREYSTNMIDKLVEKYKELV